MAEANATQMRDALAWATGEDEPREPSANPFVWFWEAIEGDFNESRSTSQILVDAGISMIPLVDQVCDLRDLIANCRKLSRDQTDSVRSRLSPSFSWVITKPKAGKSFLRVRSGEAAIRAKTGRTTRGPSSAIFSGPLLNISPTEHRTDTTGPGHISAAEALANFRCSGWLRSSRTNLTRCSRSCPDTPCTSMKRWTEQCSLHDGTILV